MRRASAPFAPASLRQEKEIHGHHSGSSPRFAFRQTEPAFRVYGLMDSVELAW